MSAWPRRLRCLLVAILLLGVHGTGLAQSDEEKAREQLRLLEHEIQRISREIASDSARRDKLQDQLRRAEVELGQLRRSITSNEATVQAENKKLAELKTKRTELGQSRDRQQARIALELKTAWQLGREEQVKALLNQENPDTVARVMAYYRYFFNARQDLLAEYRRTLADLEQVQQDIDQSIATLQQRRRELEQQREKLVAAQRTREKAVASLNASIDSSNAALQKKEADRKQLEELLRSIEEAVDKLQMPDNYQPFSSVKGAMPWPIEGKPSNRFGRWRTEGKMRWQGVTVPAREGTEIQAIHHGRVVYADWLRGSGLLLIVDHGDGYMSLYAHNETLLKDVGEWVSAGTPIGTVGSTGGRDNPALYFEIRHNGKPQNPARWCKG